MEARLSKDHLLLEKAQMQEEVRKAKHESEKLQLKENAADAKHVQELNLFRNCKAQLDWLKMQLQKVVTESPIFFNHRFSTLLELDELKTEIQLILKVVELQQVVAQEEREDNLNQTDPLLPRSIQQLAFEIDRLKQTMQFLKPRAVMQEGQRHHKSNVTTQQKTGPFQVMNFNAIAENILTELYSKGTHLRYHCCVVCKSLVEMRYHCHKYPNLILCKLCYQKGNHCHKMDILGFDLDVQKLPTNCKTIDEARNSRTGLRIYSFLHGLQCVDANCREPFCKSMKQIIEHCRSCRFKMTKLMTDNNFDSKSSCAICGELVALIIYHAKLCTQSICRVPHCSSGKKWIKAVNCKIVAIQTAQRKGSIKKPSCEPRPSVLPNNVNTSTAELPHYSLKAKQEEDPSALAHDVAVMDNQTIAHMEVSPGATKSQTARPVESDADTRKIVREEILLMIHAHECRQQQNQRQQCSNPHCSAMKNILHHVRSCVSFQPCQPNCQPMRMIISHLKNCSLPDCVYCSAMTEADRYRAITDPNPIIIASELPSSKICNATEIRRNPSQLANYYPGVSNSIPNSRVL